MSSPAHSSSPSDTAPEPAPRPGEGLRKRPLHSTAKGASSEVFSKVEGRAPQKKATKAAITSHTTPGAAVSSAPPSSSYLFSPFPSPAKGSGQRDHEAAADAPQHDKGSARVNQCTTPAREGGGGGADSSDDSLLIIVALVAVLVSLVVVGPYIVDLSNAERREELIQQTTAYWKYDLSQRWPFTAMTEAWESAAEYMSRRYGGGSDVSPSWKATPSESTKAKARREVAYTEVGGFPPTNIRYGRPTFTTSNPSVFAMQYTNYEESEELLEKAANDPTFTQYENERVYFRPVQRKVALDAAGQPLPFYPYQYEADGGNRLSNHDREQLIKANAASYVTVWGMAEINPLTNTLMTDPDTLSRIPCAGEYATLHFHLVGYLPNGERFETTYLSGNEEKVEAWYQPPCLERILQLMCVGDKWEVLCPPEMLFGKDGSPKGVPPYRAAFYRLDLRDMIGVGNPIAAADAELGFYVTRQEDRAEAKERTSSSEPGTFRGFTRAAMLKKVTRYTPQVTYAGAKGE